jgi:hypothetical protein
MHRKFRFTLRALLVAIFGICGWLAHEVYSANRFVAAEAAVFGVGGGYYTVPRRLGFTPPQALQRWLGREYFANDAVVYLQLRYSSPNGQIVENGITDDVLAKVAPQLQGFRHITRLHLDGSQITDNALRHLEGLHNLKEVDLRQTNVSSRGVHRLKSVLPNCTITWE